MSLQSAAFPPVAPNAASLPYSVRLKGWPLAGVIAFNGFILLLMLVAGFGVFRDSLLPLRHWWLGALFASVSVFSAFRLWRLKDPEAVLYPDRLERADLFAPRVIYRSDIAGVSKTVSSRYGSYFSIVPKPGQGESLSLAGSLRDDPVFAEWLRGAADPSALAIAADRSSVMADYRYGSSEQERSARLDLSKNVVIGFSILCVVIGASLAYFDVLPLLALGAAAACLGAAAVLVRLFDGLIVWIPAGGVRASPLAALIPAGALAFRGFSKVHLISVEPLMIAAGLAGVALALAAFQLRPGAARRLQSSAAMGILGAILAYGAGAYLDALTVGKPIHSYVVTVEDKYVSSGRSTTYYLDLAPWGDQPARHVSVPSAFYDRTDVGSNVCIDRYRGDLGIPWFNVGACLKSQLKTRDAYLGEAAALMRTGRIQDAIKDWEQAAVLDPRSEAAWGQLALAHAWMGNTKQAEADLSKAAALDPGGPYVVEIRGVLAEAERRPSEALADFNKVLAQTPKNDFVRENRANVELELSSYQAALSDIDEVLSGYPRDGNSLVIKAKAYLGLNRLDQVRGVAAVLDPASTDQHVLLTRAHILSIGEDRAGAIATLGRAIDLKPTAAAYFDRAQMQVLSDPNAARADAEAALKIAPGWPPAVRLLAGIDQRAKDGSAQPN